jgi:RNA polymerase sigma-70 factor (ECF subfamily)
MAGDRQLVERARAGQADAQHALFDRCWPLVWRVACTTCGRRDLAEEAAQNAMVNIFRGLTRIDTDRPLDPWVRRVATNAALSELRRMQRDPAIVDTDDLSPHARPDENTDDVALYEAVSRLGHDRRVVVVLHYWLDYSVSQIAELLGIPPGTVASRIGRALRELRFQLEEEHAHSA